MNDISTTVVNKSGKMYEAEEAGKSSQVVTTLSGAEPVPSQLRIGLTTLPGRHAGGRSAEEI